MKFFDNLNLSNVMKGVNEIEFTLDASFFFTINISKNFSPFNNLPGSLGVRTTGNYKKY